MKEERETSKKNYFGIPPGPGGGSPPLAEVRKTSPNPPLAKKNFFYLA